MDELIEKIEELLKRINNANSKLEIPNKILELEKLQKQIENPDFWKDTKKAKEISKKASDLEEEIKLWQDLKNQAAELLEIAQLDKEDKTVSLSEELNEKFLELERKFADNEFVMKFSGEYDKSDVLLTIFSGSGGTDAQDWAEMLLRMYLRYFEKKGFAAKIIEIAKGQEAGIKRAVLQVLGKYAYGYLKSESGVHRLVRISPFDAEKMRHTSFAMVEVLPMLPEASELKIDPDDLKIEVFRASGHGGQKVNKTESAVRITHLPTKISASCQSERSQLRNKEIALSVILSKVQKYNDTAAEEEKKKLKGEYTEAAWGNQIRSYVLHPYKMVKDHRTEFETSDVQNVLDGNIDDFIESYLLKSPTTKIQKSKSQKTNEIQKRNTK